MVLATRAMPGRAAATDSPAAASQKKSVLSLLARSCADRGKLLSLVD